MTTTTRRTYTCGRCGRKLRPHIDKYIYSTWTKQRYCSNLDACAQRAARKERKS